MHLLHWKILELLVVRINGVDCIYICMCIFFIYIYIYIYIYINIYAYRCMRTNESDILDLHT